MSIPAPQGILNIPNATLRVGKLVLDEIVGADTIMNTVARNTILLVDDTEYTANKNWALKLPNAWAGVFDIKTTGAGKYAEFNFYNEGASSNAQGYNLTFNDTTVELRYDGGSALVSGTVSTVVNTYRKVHLLFERNILSVTVDGTLIFTYTDTSGPRPRVYSTTAGGFLNFFTDGGAIDTLKIVNEKWISDGTSNIAYVGGGEVAIGHTLAFNRVSNVNQIKVGSNVVAEYTGPHDRPLRKYPEVAMTAATTGGYIVTESGTPYPGGYQGWKAFDEVSTTEWITDQTAKYSTSTPFDADSPSTDGLSGISGVAGTRAGSWVKLELPKKIRLQKTEIFRRDVSDQRFDQAYVYGSNDDTNWYQLSSITSPTYGQPASASGDMGPSIISHSTDTITSYKYFVIQITSLVDNTGTANIGQAYFYGHEEGDSSLDTTLKSVYNVPGTQQLEVYYDAKNYTSGVVPDLSTNSLNGTLTNGATFDNSDGIGKFTFDGSNDYISGSIPSTFTGNQTYTFSTWIKPTSHPSSGFIGIFEAGTRSTDDAFGLYLNAGNIVHIVYGTNLATTTLAPVGQWTHITGTYTSGDRKVYANGVLLGQDTYSALTLAGTTLVVGANSVGTQPFTGSIANFRLFSKALNAGQVQELYDYQKDYFLGSRSSVTLYKGHLGIGVAEPSGQLELAGDERIQEYPPRAMTGYENYFDGHGAFYASWSSNPAGDAHFWYGWQAFDGDPTTNINLWHSDGGYSTSGTYAATSTRSLGGYQGDWVRLDMPYKIKLTSFRLRSRYGSIDQAPKSFVIIGSNTGNEWDVVFTTGDAALVDTVSKDFTVNSTKYYKYYALVVASLAGTGGSAAISELRYFGTPGPTTLDKGSLTLGRSLDVPRISRYDVDTETPRPEKLVLDFDTTVNNSPTDISGRGNHGRFYADASYSAADKAFKFDGTNDVLYVASGTGLPIGDAIYTLSCWIKPGTTQITTNPSVFYFGSAWASNELAGIYLRDGNKVAHDIGSTNVYTTNPTLTPNKWHHIVIVKRGTGTIVATTTYQGIFVDGVEITELSRDGSDRQQALGTIDNISIGHAFAGTVGSGGAFGVVGCVSKPQIWNVALEASEVKKLYNLGRTGRSMVISDTAVGIGKVPEAQLDVRGTGKFSGDVNFGGNVGIGKTDPATALDVLGTIRVQTGTNDATGGEFSIDTNVGHIRRKVAGNGVSLTSYDDFQFYVNATGGSAEGGTQAMIIDNSGNVGIGTNNPLCPLDVHLAVAGDVDVEDAFDGYILTWTGVSQFDNYMTHNVAITADNNSAAIVAHNFLAGYSINFLSDRRIKKDIKEIDDESALEKFRLLKPSKYKYIEPLLSGRTDKEVYGYIAQEVAEVLPEGVTICDSNENTNQGHIPNIMSMCHIESQSISSDAYDILDAEQKSEYIETGNTYTRQVVTITETIDLDTFSVIDSTPRYKTSKQTKTTGAFDKRSDGEYHPLIFYSKNLQTIRANIVRVIDDSSFVVDKNLLDVHKFKNDKLLLYGQKPNDFHRLNKDVIFTLATAALQEVDRQLQAEKTKVTTLETQLASVLARLDALESA